VLYVKMMDTDVKSRIGDGSRKPVQMHLPSSADDAAGSGRREECGREWEERREGDRTAG